MPSTRMRAIRAGQTCEQLGRFKSRRRAGRSGGERQPERSFTAQTALSKSDRRRAGATGREMAASGEGLQREGRSAGELCLFEEGERREDRAEGGQRCLLAGSALQRTAALAAGERLPAVRPSTGARLVQKLRQVNV